MKLRLPLYAKILGWLFLNIALAGAALLLLAQTQFHFGLDSLVAGRAGERLQALGDVISGELSDSPRPSWDAKLARFGAAYNVELRVFRPNGTQLAGAPLELPAAVLERLREGGPPGGGGRPHEDWRDLGPRPPEDPPALERRPEQLPRPPGRRVMVHTFEPSRYWVLLRLPLKDDVAPRPIPGVLVAESSSLSAGGLFFDMMPWLTVSAGVLALSMLLWIPFVRGLTRAIAQMNAATERIAEGNFDVRVSARRRDELGSLAHSINEMAGRLEGFVAGQKRFLGDIAHELCTPIARMQMALGILEQRAADPQHVEDVREELQEMSLLVNELLSFSKASLGGKLIAREPVAVRAMVEKVIAHEASGTGVQVEIPAELRVLAAPDLLQRALANLLRNAVRYAGAGAPIGVTACEAREEVLLTVWDGGGGIPDNAREEIFDPFFRLDPSRDRQTGGVGLGLAIVKTCVESSGGSITCGAHASGGAEFLLRLPGVSGK